MIKILFVVGTRPEAIKLAPLIIKCKLDDCFQVKVCLTSQHGPMLTQVLKFFNIVQDYDLEIMKEGQTLYDITARVLTGLEQPLSEFEPNLLVVQGDTTTAWVGALAAFYSKIKIVHIEAGLRSQDKLSPFPEEVNRKLVSVMADYHFAPTEQAARNLRNENITQNVFVTGNTVIDALLMANAKMSGVDLFQTEFHFLDSRRKIILITGHRRESFGKPFEDICIAIKEIAIKFPNVQLVYPVHLNPNVQKPVRTLLSSIQNVFLIPPIDYPSIVWLMNHSYLVLTDSGGIQEEAPALGKPVLVMRTVTERQEGVTARTAKLVGTKTQDIFDNVCALLEDAEQYKKMANSVNPYGDGTSCEQIIKILKNLE